MPVLKANNIQIQFADGTTLFENISCSLNHQRVAIVGRNGIGKSLLAEALVGKRELTSGSVQVSANIGHYTQIPSMLLSSKTTIAQFLQIDLILEAIAKIAEGECEQALFDIVGDQWQLKEELETELARLNIPNDLNFPCNQLSGGQLARLQLWRLFQNEHDLLLLDEPSNHLDYSARLWLIDQMKQYHGHILLISHDRMLLREVEQIWELSGLGLKQFGGNYDFYAEQKQLEVAALERQMESVASAQKRLEQKAQKSRERAEQRAAQGNKLRKTGSQPKILLDGMRDSAEVSASNRNKNLNGRRESLQAKQSELSQRYEQVKAQKIYLGEGAASGKQLISIVQGVLPFGNQEPINLQLTQSDKYSLEGNNGSGKSTLLSVLRGKRELLQGECHINSATYYLDQHFSLIDGERSLLANLVDSNSELTESDTRTLLAGIGFRRDNVYRKASELSGGEKMKLAMLIVANKPQPALLLLDEPDNHLDLDSKLLLAGTLNQYQGAFIVVSHDKEFVHDCGVTQTLILE